MAFVNPIINRSGSFYEGAVADLTPTLIFITIYLKELRSFPLPLREGGGEPDPTNREKPTLGREVR
jgi:hypothetical protein